MSAASQPAAPATQPTVRIDLSSPRATLETMQRAAEANDVAGYVRCLDPRMQAPMRTALMSSAKLRAAADRAATAIDLRIGGEQADQVRRLVQGETLVSPLSAAADSTGRVDWSKVEVAAVDDRATVKIDGKALPISLRVVRSEWRVVPPAADKLDAAALVKTAKDAAAANDSLAERLAELDRLVQAGKITRASFAREFRRVLFETVH